MIKRTSIANTIDRLFIQDSQRQRHLMFPLKAEITTAAMYSRPRTSIKIFSSN